MNIREIIKLSASEKDCEDYLIEKGVLKRFETCYKCGHPGPKRIRRDRYFCYKCDSEWSVRRDSFLNTLYISYSQFIMCVKMFELEVSITRCSKELGLTRKTISKVQNVIYDNLTSHQKAGKKIIKDKTPFYRISLVNNQIKVEQLEQVEQNDERDNKFYVFGIRRKDSGGNVFYDFNTSKNLRRGKKSINIHGEIGSFWSFASERLISFNGSSSEHLHGKFKEIELRFNCIKEEKDYFTKLLSFYNVRNFAKN